MTIARIAEIFQKCPHTCIINCIHTNTKKCMCNHEHTWALASVYRHSSIHCSALQIATERNAEGFGTGDFGNTLISLLKKPVASHGLRIVQEKKDSGWIPVTVAFEFICEGNSVKSVQLI
ncbi:hypothetical protein M5K25_019490 [Dendrobium thyrsiflorum]|uniref:Uncharacterized protein n=1 Tax=Dendrobium thyrsiflorum TaxID=117978 RepID=A0ABD0UFJ7_DENTH